MRQDGNAVDWFLDRHVREERGDRVAFTDPWRSISYAGLVKETVRFAVALAQAGIRQERRIALVMLDTVDFPIAFWGSLRAGVVPVPINTLLTPETTEYILKDSRAEAVVVTEALAGVLPHIPGLRVIEAGGSAFADFLFAFVDLLSPFVPSGSSKTGDSCYACPKKTATANRYLKPFSMPDHPRPETVCKRGILERMAR